MLESFIKMKTVNGMLTPYSKADQRKYDLFVKAIPKNEIIEVYLQHTEGKLGTLSQLAKLHASIKEISDFTKQDFFLVKRQIKELCGIYNIVSTEPYTKELKSFGDCSIEELGTAIAKCEEIIGIIYSN
jgi:hypothetical protein